MTIPKNQNKNSLSSKSREGRANDFVRCFRETTNLKNPNGARNRKWKNANKLFIPSRRLFITIVFFLSLILIPNFASAFLVSDQGTTAREISTGDLIALANLTISIYDNLTGGNLIFEQNFSDAIVNGSWNIMINPSLEYGKSYYKDYKINGEDLDFDGNERLNFQSSVGKINNISFINFSIINSCSAGSSIRLIYENGSVECETDDSSGVPNLTNYALKNQSETFTGNITTSQTGFFGWLGSLVSRITKLLVQDIDFNGTINGSGDINITGNITASYLMGDGSLLTNLPAGSGDNSSWNETYADTIYADISVTGNNSSWNKTYADTLYAPTGSGNSSWNESYARTIFYDEESDLTTLLDDDYADISVTGDNSSFNQSLTDTLYSPANYGDDWNKTYADTLYADISVTGDNSSWNQTHADTLYADISVTDTNETTRINTITGTDCGEGNYSYGFDASGNVQCREDTTSSVTDTNASTACSVGEYLDGSGSCINFNETVDDRDSDTTYTNGTGISLVGNVFSLIGSFFSGSWNDLTDIPSGFADGIDNDTAGGLTHLTNFTDDLGNRGYTNNLNFTNGANYWNSTFALFNKTYADTLYADISVTGDNSSWNQTLADTLYAGVEWDYNQTTSANTYTDNQLANYVQSGTADAWAVKYQNISNLPTCGADEHLDYDGSTLSCTADAAGGSDNSSWNETYADTLYADISVTGDNSSWNEGHADTLYADISVTGDNSSFNQSLTDTLYRLQSWDNITGTPTATPSDGDTNHLSTADQIYDWVIGLDYTSIATIVASIGNWSADEENYYNTTQIDNFNYYNETNPQPDSNYTEDEIEAFIFDDDNTASMNTTGNITADYFIGDGSQLENLPAGTETDPLWSSNFTAHNTSWSTDTDTTYSHLSNFTNDQGYYNSTDFDYNDYYLKSNPFNFWNSTFALFNKTYADTLYAGSSVTGDNSSWNQTLAGTLYADISVTGDNSSWNQTHADTLYANISVINTNCSSDGSCSSIAYDSEINKTYVDAQDSAQDACSEITGCVENAITDGNTNWDNSYGFYDNITNFTGTLTDGKICIYDSTSQIINCTYTDQTGASGNPKAGDGTYLYNNTNTIYFNSTYAEINLEVNGSDYWDGLGSPSDINTADITNDGTYRLQSWNNLTGIPHATPSNGDVTHFSLADEIYDWVIGLDYTSVSTIVASIGNWSNDKSDYWNASTDLDDVIATDEITELKIDFNTVCAAGNHLYVDGNNLACETDEDTTHTAGNKLYLSGTQFNVNDTEINSSIEAYGYITSSSDTNASTACSGTTTYLDGEGNCDDISSVYAPANYGDDWNKTYTDTLYADISVTGDNSSWNQTHANTLYYGIGNPSSFYNSTDFDYNDYYLSSNPSNYWNSTFATFNKTYADTLYRLQSWDNLTGIPHATPSDGDTTHFSLADEIYDWVISLSYATTTVVNSLGNWSADKSDYWNTSTDLSFTTNLTTTGNITTTGTFCFTADCSAKMYHNGTGIIISS